MTFNIVHSDNGRRRIAGSLYQGRSGVTPGSQISDLCALHKTVCLCPLCQNRFNPASHDYIQARRPPISNGAVGTCDGCREKMVRCTIFVPLSHEDAKGAELCA